MRFAESFYQFSPEDVSVVGETDVFFIIHVMIRFVEKKNKVLSRDQRKVFVICSFVAQNCGEANNKILIQINLTKTEK